MTTTKNYSLQQILAAWIVKNNPSGVKIALQNNSLISASANPSKSEMVNILYDYYLKNGNNAFINLIKQVPVNENISEAEKQALAGAYEEIRVAYGGLIAPMYPSNARVAQTSTGKWWNDVLDVVTGTSTTTTEPVVTVETTTSPLVIGGLIAAVLLVLGLAYFFIGRRAVA